VSELPLAQRDAYQLLQLQPGVQSQVGLDSVYGSDRAGVVSVNGGRGRDNNFTVNGGDGNDQFAGLPAIQPSPDAIAEFRVLTNTFDAEYGAEFRRGSQRGYQVRNERNSRQPV